jgi:hypothetical protein
LRLASSPTTAATHFCVQRHNWYTMTRSKPFSGKRKNPRFQSLLIHLSTMEWRARPKTVSAKTMVAASKQGFVEVRYTVFRDEIKLTKAGQDYLREITAQERINHDPL